MVECECELYFQIDCNTEWKKRMTREALKRCWKTEKEGIKCDRKIFIRYPEKHVGHFVGNVSSIMFLYWFSLVRMCMTNKK